MYYIYIYINPPPAATTPLERRESGVQYVAPRRSVVPQNETWGLLKASGKTVGAIRTHLKR